LFICRHHIGFYNLQMNQIVNSASWCECECRYQQFDNFNKGKSRDDHAMFSLDKPNLVHDCFRDEVFIFVGVDLILVNSSLEFGLVVKPVCGVSSVLVIHVIRQVILDCV